MRRLALLAVALFCASVFAQEGDGASVPPTSAPIPLPAPIGSAPLPALIPLVPVSDGAPQEAVLPATLTEDGVQASVQPQQIVEEPLEPPPIEPLVEQPSAPPETIAASRVKDLPPIAVYVTGNVPDEDKKALGTLMLAALAKSGRYIAIERSNDFLAAVEAEHIKQRSGDVDDSQIRKLGKQFGVQFVCVADITKAFGSVQISTRIIDVETAVIVHIGEVYGKVKSMGDLARVSDKVLDNMFDNEDSKPRRLHNRQTAAWEFRIGGFSDIEISRPAKSGRLDDGFTLNVYGDQNYVEGQALIFTQPIIPNIENHNIENYKLCMFGHFLGKYPIEIGIIKVSPLLGCSLVELLWLSSDTSVLTYSSYNREVDDTAFIQEMAFNMAWLFTLGGRVDVGLSKSSYVSAEYLHGFGSSGSTLQSLKINSGLDLGLGKKKRWFWRPELAYIFRRAVLKNSENFLELPTYEKINRETGWPIPSQFDADEYTEISIHDFAVYVGIGYKLRGKKQRL